VHEAIARAVSDARAIFFSAVLLRPAGSVEFFAEALVVLRAGSLIILFFSGRIT